MKKQILLLIAIIVSLTSYGQDAELIAKAEAGDAESQYRLAINYETGTSGCPKDDSKYVYWLTKAAEGGNVHAQFSLAFCFGGTHGVAKNDTMYVFWMEKVAVSGNERLQKYALSLLARHFNLLDPNNKKCAYWLKKAAESGCEDQYFSLALNYLYGTHGFQKNSKEFLKWSIRGANSGDSKVSCCRLLGKFYKNKNKKEAIYWLKRGMNIRWEEDKEEDEDCAEILRELGVYYHPGEKDSYASSSSSGASSSHSSSSSRGNGSSAAVAPLMTPVQVWNPCFMCGGTGLCTSCQGKGKDWYGNSYQLCVTCHGNMYCQKCYGRKGYYTTEYR